MHPAETKLDALAYVLATVALLAITVLPIIALAMPEVQPVGKLIAAIYWLVGGVAIWWAVRRFRGVGERVAALIGIVVGWYIVLQILLALNTMVFIF